MKNKWGWRKKHNLTECATAIVLGIVKLTLMGRGDPAPTKVIYEIRSTLLRLLLDHNLVLESGPNFRWQYNFKRMSLP